MRVDLLIFDLDGVLVESEIVVASALSRMLAEIGIEISQQEIIRRFHYWPYQRITEHLAAEQGVSVPDGFMERLPEAHASALEKLDAVSGAAAALEALGQPKCVASGSRPYGLKRKLELTGLLHHFGPRLYSAFELGRPKPAPDVFLLAARECGAEPANCLVIEDAVVGIKAARAAGMHALGFCGATHCHEGWAEGLTAAGAHAVIDDLGKLPAYIDRLIEGAAGRP